VQVGAYRRSNGEAEGDIRSGGKFAGGAALSFHGRNYRPTVPGMKATLDVVLFLLAGIAMSAASVAGAVAAFCAVAGGGCWLWWRRRRPRSRR